MTNSSPRTVTPRGRAARRAAQVERVRAYQAWLRAGSPLRGIPDIPRNADYRAFRRETGTIAR